MVFLTPRYIHEQTCNLDPASGEGDEVTCKKIVGVSTVHYSIAVRNSSMRDMGSGHRLEV